MGALLRAGAGPSRSQSLGDLHRVERRALQQLAVAASPPRSPLRFGGALALAAAGLAFTVWARVHLGRNWSGSVTLKEGHELILSGPYAWVRHPIYTGLLMALLGSAVACGELRAAIGLGVVAAAFVRKLRIEERFMRESFPQQYPRYCAQVPALIPFTKPPRSVPR